MVPPQLNRLRVYQSRVDIITVHELGIPMKTNQYKGIQALLNTVHLHYQLSA